MINYSIIFLDGDDNIANTINVSFRVVNSIKLVVVN